MTGALLAWWALLCGAAALNVVALGFSFWFFRRNRRFADAGIHATRRLLLWLSVGYVLGCAFRSVFPMIDVPRFCLHHNWISRIAVGRTIATLAELCFAAQWALLLREASGGRGYAALAARLVFALIVVAEMFSWGAVLTSNYLLHAVENSLWTLAAGLALAGFVSLRSRPQANTQRFLVAAGLCGGAYIAFMVLVDVPMYLSRWQADAAGSRALAEGLQAVLQRCTVERDWLSWREDVPWLSLYFTVAVWISIALAHAPPLKPAK